VRPLLFFKNVRIKVQMKVLQQRNFFGLGMFSCVLTVASFLIVQEFFLSNVVEGQSSAPQSLSGYAWDSNMGWISSSGTWVNLTTGSSGNYGVELFGNNFQGYAWSSNAGWIRFNPVITVSGGDALPVEATDAHGVKLEGANVTGWARACSVFANSGLSDTACSGNLKDDSKRGGWDGWIKMSGTWTNGVTYDQPSSEIRGYAWGSDVLGWIDFCGTYSGNGSYCVKVDSIDVKCTANGLENGGAVNINPPSADLVTWEALVISGDVGPFTHCWGISCDPDLTGTVSGVAQSVTGSYPTVGPVTAEVQVTETATGKQGRGTCSIEVRDANNPSLNIGVVGGDKGLVNVNPDPLVGSIDGCRVNDGSCTGTYSLNTSVAILAVPGLNPNTVPPNQPYNFSWSEVGCNANTSPCNVTVGAGGKDVTVTFIDQTISDPTFSVVTPVIAIEFQNAGRSEESNKSTITLTGGAPAEICVDSFKSFTTNLIEQIIDSIPGSHDPVQCAFGGEDPGSCSSSSANCVTLNNIGDSVTFSVVVPEKLIEILNNSPYFIKLKSRGTTVPIRFEYRVRDIRP